MYSTVGLVVLLLNYLISWFTVHIVGWLVLNKLDSRPAEHQAGESQLTWTASQHSLPVPAPPKGLGRETNLGPEPASSQLH